jgi:hypothetical protein
MDTVIYVGSYYDNDCHNGDGNNEQDDNEMTMMVTTKK